ncbi:uncharacterized protein [Macrobrachium rosenbergii]|uniref:uncharacterized protein n=1 Tax=Macrobrachium rosenbergii TaxID=79674 RepID=UPI0034D66EE2
MMQWSAQALFALLAVAVGYSILHKDNRFPSHILTANTPCITNGSFRHPSNCSWFYKCENKTVQGYYQKQFFECAPGTVFDDALDICIPKSADSQTSCPEPDPIDIVCVKHPPTQHDYCYPKQNCNGIRTPSGMCHYQVVCTENSTVVYCDMHMPVNAGIPCTNSSNAVCLHFKKGDFRF